MSGPQTTPLPFDAARDGWVHGPSKIVLLGPPGTGKTTSAIDAWLLPAIQAGIPTDQVLSCSFSVSAAKTIRERLARNASLDEAALKATCSTIHAEALRLGGAGADVAEKSRRVPEEEISERAEKEPEAASLALWDLARNAVILDVESPEFAALALDKVPQLALSEVRSWIQHYEERKKREGQLDFADMLVRALNVDPPKRSLLVVDEAQDCSALHWRLIERWGAASDVTAIVSDFDQAVHEWCGAVPHHIFDLLRAGYECRRLEQSHRVPRRVHSVATDLIQRNKNRIEAPYLPRPVDGSVEVVSYDEALKAIDEASQREGGDVFVLARSSFLLRRWAAGLRDRAVPFRNEHGPSPLNVPAALAITRAILGIRAGALLSAEDAAALVTALPDAGPTRFFLADKQKVLESCSGFFALRGRTPEQLAASGLHLETIRTLGIESLLVAAGLGNLARDLAALAKRSPTIFQAGARPPVVLATMHGSKGREKSLVVVDLECPRLVARSMAANGEPVAATERRVLYVALTRARERLLLVPGGRRDLGNELGLDLRAGAFHG